MSTATPPPDSASSTAPASPSPASGPGAEARIPRRRVLRHAATAALVAAGAGRVGFPTIIPSRVLGADAPSKRITVGFIGTGQHGIARNLDMFMRQKDAQVVAVCDVFRDRREQARNFVNASYRNQDCAEYVDFREIIARKDIDAVMISTPDHWHCLMSVLAVRSGKDVICEKPTLTIQEGRLLADTVKKHDAVFQTSTEDRSLPLYHRMAELVRNGRIGKLQRIRVQLPTGNRYPDEAPAPVPEGLDYDLWLGPAPEAPYTPSRTKPMHWRQIEDYSGGLLTDWGAHQIDTAQWANDSELTTPVEVKGEGSINEGSMFNTFVDYKLEYRYANGVEMIVESGGTGLRFEGTDGWVGNRAWVEPLEASSPEILASEIGEDETRLFTCPEGEQRNFLDCVKSRALPYLPAEPGHRLSTIMHIGNIAMKVGRPLRWDPEAEEFPGDAEANALRSRPLRKPWSFDA